MKIDNDKYYTPISIANYCIDKVVEIIGLENITECIEPSIGKGSFCYHASLRPTIGYDIAPECGENMLTDNPKLTVYKEDYLKVSLPYKKGRLVIGNPPFGHCLNLAQKFYKKSIELGDYIAFILPISQYNNTNSMYEFNLVYSEDLGVQEYSGRKLHCCFNIYSRDKSGKLNTKKAPKTTAITIIRQDSKDYDKKPFDIRMCYWGNGSVGKILKDDEHYSGEYKIVINNKQKYDEIYNFIVTFDWRSYVSCVAMSKLQQFHIIQALKENVKDIEITDGQATIF